MIQGTKNPALAGAGLVVTFEASQPNVSSQYSRPIAEIHHLRVNHLQRRYGLSHRRAGLIADHVFGGGHG